MAENNELVRVVAWEVEVSDEFMAWWTGLDESEQISVATVIGLLAEKGPSLAFPY